MSGPFGSTTWGYEPPLEFDNWGGTVKSLTRGTEDGSAYSGVYNLSNQSSVSYSTTGGGMYVVGLHQKVARWIGIANGTSIQGQTGQMYSQGGIFQWQTAGYLSYRFNGISFTYTSGTFSYATDIPYVILDMTDESGYANQIRLYGGDDSLIHTFNYDSNTTWYVYTCTFDGGLLAAWDLEPIGQANYSFS